MNNFKQILEWNVEMELGDLREDINRIFDNCFHKIRYAYSPVKVISWEIKRKIRDDKIIKISVETFRKCKFIERQSKEYHILLFTIIDTVAHGKTEGFGDWLLDVKDRDEWPVHAINYVEKKRLNFVQLLKIYDNQLCEAYR